MGARTDQVYRSVVFESLILGAVSSALGVGAGVGVMELVARSGALGSMVHLRVVLTVWTFIVPIVFGTIATIVASLGAARMATRVTPLEAMRPMEAADQSATHRGRAILGTVMMLAGIALAIFAMRHVDQSSAMLAAMAGCALLFIGTAVTARFWLPWLMKGLGALASHCGPSAKLAAANISKNPRRVAATGTALLIGVTLVATMGTGAACAKQTMDTALATRYSTDVVITDVPQNQADKLATRIKGQEGVRNVLAAPVATVTVKGQVPAAMKEDNANTTVRLLGVPDIKALSGVLNVDCSHLKLDADTVILPEYLPANGKKLDPGAHISVSEQDDTSPSAPGTVNLTPQTLDFRGVLPYGATAGFVNETLFDNGTLQAGSAILLISIDQHSAAPMSDIMDALHSDIASIAAAQLVGPIAEKQQWDQMVDMMLMLLVVLLAVAVIIALIGVANTLSLSVIERTRESATLRAIGMTKEQLRASLGIEACLITLVASITGLLLGTAFGALGTYMVMKPAVGSYSFATDWRVDIAILAIAILAALAASIGPARRANKVLPVEALAEN
ncbi:FtsX-like permease family protein [Bifidobacterium magnum]|uniref:FtsX-like permease family protein n=1 Tax=Bifidobacterium magnum TaxID=1692 RepID=UPI000683D6EF|nr:ABC transporter permease [Bifidobacterium magnum]